MRDKRAIMVVAVLCTGMFCGRGWADSLVVSEAEPDPVKGGTQTVRFDLQWENSWRNDLAGTGKAEPNNYDAAWVFVKYCVGTGEWNHATLSTKVTDHTVPAGVALSVGQTAGPSAELGAGKGVGVFIYRSANGKGRFTAKNVGLCWQRASDKVADDAKVTVKVFALEMVYIPEGRFYLGSGGNEPGHFYQYTDGSQDTKPFLVTSETNPITVGKAAGNLCYAGGGDGTGPLSSSFPKGYAAFYCMKYMLSQGQYTDFLNKLTPTQAKMKDTIKGLDFIHQTCKDTNYTISWSGTKEPERILAPKSPDDPILSSNDPTIIDELMAEQAPALVHKFLVKSPDLACTWMGWLNSFAYAAWAGLRPMTELEYEKACRGPATPVPNEYAWGSADRPPQASVAGTSESGTGKAKPAGASYYGVLDLTGNLWERCMTAGSARGRKFQGTHGSGTLRANGLLNGAYDIGSELWDNADWEGTILPYGSKAEYHGITGYRSGPERVSFRGSATCMDGHAEGAHQPMGWRAVRTAP